MAEVGWSHRIGMTRLIKILLWSIAGAFLIIRRYQMYRNPSLEMLPWPYYAIWLVGLTSFYGFQIYRHRRSCQLAPEPNATTEQLTRSERFVFRALGLPVIFCGLILVGLGTVLAWHQWIKVARWPRVNAILLSKDISSVGARLTFQYEAGGQRLTGVGFRWGSEASVRSALENYKPGTIQKISYDPEDASQVETILSYSSELFLAPISAIVGGLFFSVLGVGVYRWSYGRFTAPLWSGGETR